MNDRHATTSCDLQPRICMLRAKSVRTAPSTRRKDDLPSPAMRRALGTVALIILTAACSGNGGDSEPVNAAAAGAAVDDHLTPPTPIPMPDWCTPASPEDITLITQNLAGTGNQLIDAFTTTLADGTRLIMANLNRADGQRLTSAEVWAITPDGQASAVTSGARDYSILPDGSAMAGDSALTPLTDCLTASAQQRNLGTP